MGTLLTLGTLGIIPCVDTSGGSNATEEYEISIATPIGSKRTKGYVYQRRWMGWMCVFGFGDINVGIDGNGAPWQLCESRMQEEMFKMRDAAVKDLVCSFAKEDFKLYAEDVKNRDAKVSAIRQMIASGEIEKAIKECEDAQLNSWGLIEEACERIKTLVPNIDDARRLANLYSLAQNQSIIEEQIFLRLCELNKVDVLPRETVEDMATHAERKDVQIAAMQSLKDVDKAKSIVWNVPVDAELFKGFLKSYGTEDVIMELIKSSNRRLLTKEISDIILEHTKSQQVVDAIANLNASSELKGLGGIRLGVKYNVADSKLLKGLSDIGCYQPDIDYYMLSNHKNKLPGFGCYRMFLTPETGTLFRLSAHSESDKLEFGGDGVPTLVRAFEEKFGLQFVKAETSNMIEDRTTWSARVGDRVVSVNTSFVGSPVSYSSYYKSWVEMVDESLEKLAKDETVRLNAKAEQAKKQANKKAMDKAFGEDPGEEISGSTTTLDSINVSKAETIDGVLSREKFLAIVREANFRSNTGNEIKDNRIRDEHRSRVMGKVITVKGVVKSIEVTMFTDHPKLILNIYGKSVSARMDGMLKDEAAELDAGMQVIVRGTVCDRLVTSDLALENCVIVK